MKERALSKIIQQRITQSPIVALIGPRQVGKTTLANALKSKFRESHYFDLERDSDLSKFAEPEIFLKSLKGLIVIDEIQRRPDLFRSLRPLVDEDLKSKARKYLILGSASPELLRQSSESLAGRISYIELTGFSLDEVDDEMRLHLRGGFPRSYLAKSEAESIQWREDYIAAFVERDLPQLGVKIPSQQIRRFWMMLCHYHGQTWNGSEIGNSMQLSHTTVRHYLDLLTSTFMLRQLQPWIANIKKRQVKSPKVYIRDSGLLHSLLQIKTRSDLTHHPKLGASWEGFALENLIFHLGLLPHECFFWGVHALGEVDLVFQTPKGLVAVEIKHTASPEFTKSLQLATEELKLHRSYVIYKGDKIFPISKNCSAVGLSAMSEMEF